MLGYCPLSKHLSYNKVTNAAWKLAERLWAFESLARLSFCHPAICCKRKCLLWISKLVRGVSKDCLCKEAIYYAGKRGREDEGSHRNVRQKGKPLLLDFHCLKSRAALIDFSREEEILFVNIWGLTQALMLYQNLAPSVLYILCLVWSLPDLP